MSELRELMDKREEVANRIRAIERLCEGSENKNNAEYVLELNLRHAKQNEEKLELTRQLTELNRALAKTNGEIRQVSKSSVDRILRVIRTQRWFFFRNKPKVIFDRDTGFLWPNPTYFKVRPNDSSFFNAREAFELLRDLELDGFSNWRLPELEEYVLLVLDRSFPYATGDNKQIFGHYGSIIGGQRARVIWTDRDFPKDCSEGGILYPLCEEITYPEYPANISNTNRVFSEAERLQFTLDLFMHHRMEPIFSDNYVSELFHTLYLEKPVLVQELQELDEKIKRLREPVLLSDTLHYSLFLEPYDLSLVDRSVLEYAKAVAKVMDALIDRLFRYEERKGPVIEELNEKGQSLSVAYENNPRLGIDENQMLRGRRERLRRYLQLDMTSVTSRLLSMKEQAEAIFLKIDEINNGNQALKELAVLEKQERASFQFVVENAVNIVRSVLVQLEFFEQHPHYCEVAVGLLERWTQNYKTFKVERQEDLRKKCSLEGIDTETSAKWFKDWNKKRLIIEERFLPLVERGFKGFLLNPLDYGQTALERVVELLEQYKFSLDEFYLEDRKKIHRRFASSPSAKLQERVETEQELYRISLQFQNELHGMIETYLDVEDGLFLKRWAEPLRNLQLSEILEYVKSDELGKISEEILKQFTELKKKSFETYM